MRQKVSKKNRLRKYKKGAGPEHQNTPDIENQLDNVKYENASDIENQMNKNVKNQKINIENMNIDEAEDINIDKPKGVVEYVSQQKETSIEPVNQDVELNIPSDPKIDLGDSGYGVYDRQFYGGIKRKRKSKNKTSKSALIHPFNIGK